MTLVRRQRNRMQLVACNLFLVNLLAAVRNIALLRSILARGGPFFFIIGVCAGLQKGMQNNGARGL